MPAKTPPKAKLAPKPAATSTLPSALPLTTLTELADWLNTTPLEEVELEHAGLRLRLKKPSVGTAIGMAMPMASAPAQAAAPAAAETTAITIKSPMVGTFYRASGPDAAPFVQEGDTVAVGQTIGIIEAMKTMNQITADHAGIVAKILAANGQPVEFGQPLIQLT
jgi:acetyl-CoA carboxylase biotin carboxyl carrier protein